MYTDTGKSGKAAMEQQALSGRELEASVLTKGGLMLKSCQDNWESADRDAKLMDAIRFNQKIWSFFQAELTDPDNPMPKRLREDILNLSLFVDKRFFEMMASPERDKLSIVIDINNNIAAGLRGNRVAA